MAKPPAGFIARAMCALAAMSLITAPVLVNADAGAPGRHKVHKKVHRNAARKGKVCKEYRYLRDKKGRILRDKKGRKRSTCAAYWESAQRNAGTLPQTQTMTATTSTPAAPPPPLPTPPAPPAAVAATTTPAAATPAAAAVVGGSSVLGPVALAVLTGVAVGGIASEIEGRRAPASP
jgi:hypothetical protein